jgi:hypothetical protein
MMDKEKLFGLAVQIAIPQIRSSGEANPTQAAVKKIVEAYDIVRQAWSAIPADEKGAAAGSDASVSGVAL